MFLMRHKSAFARLMKRIASGMLILTTFVCVGCNFLDFGLADLFGGGGDNDQRVFFPLALGGVNPDWNKVELDKDTNFDDLEFSADQSELVAFAIPTGFSSFEEADAVQLNPLAVGATEADIRYDDEIQQTLIVSIPPPKLIQMLVAEARASLVSEALIEDGEVSPTSFSLTGSALSWVVRNRVQLIANRDDAALFNADSTLFLEDPPASSWAAVVEAKNGNSYEFSPVNPADTNHELYLDSDSRSNMDSENLILAYDQAVTSAAQIFGSQMGDPTNGSFAFYSPSDDEYTALLTGLFSEDTVLPAGVGISDANFPALSPIQVVILLEVASRSSDTDTPAFVFVRERISTEPAVTSVQ